MTQLLIALALFLILHAVPSLTTLRAAAIARIGRRAYLIVYSIVSLLSLLYLFAAFLMADDVGLWMDAAWQAWITIILAPIGIFFIVAGLASPNPLSITFREGQASGAIVTITRHPVLIGFLALFAGHIPPNGELRAVLLFGSFACFALFGIWLCERRGRRRFGDVWARMSASTSIIPFRAAFSGSTRLVVDRTMVMALLLTTGITGGLAFAAHEVLFGVDPLLLALYGA